MKKQISLWLKIGSVAALLVLCGGSVIGAEQMPKKNEDEKAKVKVEVAQLVGQVTAVSKMGIGLEYGATEQAAQEIYLPMNEKTQFLRILGPAELKPGDIVQVEYERSYREIEKGNRVVLKTVATQVALLRQAPLEGAMVSGEESAQ